MSVWNLEKPLALIMASLGMTTAAAEPLRVCADPDDLPYSDRAGRGFDNAIAGLVADELGRDGVSHVWLPQRQAHVGVWLDAGACEVVMGVPAGTTEVVTTDPYYRSTLVFVIRKDAGHAIEAFDDPQLENLRVGVHTVNREGSTTPGAAVLARLGLAGSTVGFPIDGANSGPAPFARLIDAVAAREVDVAIVWGPPAGYIVGQRPDELMLVPAAPAQVATDVGTTFAISMAVRRGDEALRAALDEVIVSQAAEIRAILESYGVPLVPASEPEAVADAGASPAPAAPQGLAAE